MIKQSALVGVGLFMLVSASPPGAGPGPWEAPEAQGGYPPCSRTVRDRCIQMDERAARTPENLALNDELAGGDEVEGPEHMAGAPPPDGDEFAADGDYPPCGGDVQDRCRQGASVRHSVGGGGGYRIVRYRPDVRLGERG